MTEQTNVSKGKRKRGSRRLFDAKTEREGLTDLAQQCEQRQAVAYCKGHLCGTCVFNVSLYADDPRDAVLIQMGAQKKMAEDAQKATDAQIENWFNWIKVAIFVGIMVWLIRGCVSWLNAGL